MQRSLFAMLLLSLLSCDGPARQIPLRPDADASQEEDDDDDDDDDGPAVACTSAAQCSGARAVCNPARQVCVECVRDSDCGANGECDDGECELSLFPLRTADESRAPSSP